MRPVHEDLIKYESLIDGTLSLLDVAFLNDSIDVYRENEARARKAAAKR